VTPRFTRPTRDHAVSEEEARRIVYERSGRVCELCGGHASEYSHRKARSQGGKWSPTNALHLCHNCHAYCHAHPEEAYQQGWFVRSHDDPAEQPVHITNWLGIGWYKLQDWGGYLILDLDEKALP
jgi:hypothetical protein